MSLVPDAARPSRNVSPDGDIGPQPSRPTLTAPNFIDLIVAGRGAEASGHHVDGDVQLTGKTITTMVDLRDVEFAGKVHFDHCRFENRVDLTACTFDGGLTLANSKIDGPLILQGATIGARTELADDLPMLRLIVQRLADGGRHGSWQYWEDRLAEAENRHPGKDPVADFTNLQITGDLSLAQARIFGTLVAHYISVTNNLAVGGARIFGDALLRRATLGELRTDTGAADDEPLQIDGQLDLDAVEVTGDVRLVGSSIGDDLRCQSATIKGDLICRSSWSARARLRAACRLGGTRINGSVDIRGCQIRGALDLNGMRLEGAFNGGRFDRWNVSIGPSIGSTLSARNAQFLAHVDLTGCRVADWVDLVNARIASYLFFDMATCNRWIDLSYITVGSEANFVNSTITQDVFLQGSSIGSLLNFDGTTIKGGLAMTIARIGNDMNIVGCTISKSVRLDGATIEGSLHCSSGRDGTKVYQCLIGEDIWTVGSQIGGYVGIYGVQISRNLVLNNSTIGRSLVIGSQFGIISRIGGNVFLDSSKVFNDLQFSGTQFMGNIVNLENTQIGSNLIIGLDVNNTPDWRIFGTVIAGRLNVRSATIDGSVEVSGIEVRATDDERAQQPNEIRGIDFTGARVNGRFLFYSSDSTVRLLRDRQAEDPTKPIENEQERDLLTLANQQTVVVQGDVCLAQVQVGGDLVLDGLTVTGRLDLRDANIQRNLLCQPIDASPNGKPVRASAGTTDLETLETAGDVILTGLDTGGDLVLRDVRIRGRLELYPDSGTQHAIALPRSSASQLAPSSIASTGQDQFARIDGNLLLNAAEIGHVILSGRSFDASEAPPPPRLTRIWRAIRTAWQQGDYFLIMYFLRGGHFESDTQGVPHGEEGAVIFERARIRRLTVMDPLPGMVDLNGLQVGRWDERAGFFKEMLERSHPFGQNNYTAIENQLRDQGRNEQADEIHVSMRRRDRRSTRNFSKVLADWFIDWSTEYGTTSARLFRVMAVLFVFTFLIFLDPQHVEYEILPLANQPPPVLHPPEWDAGNAAFFAVRLHVPIVSLGVDDKLQPSGTWMKAYGMVVMAASWVMWPLFIASASGLLRKRS